MMMLAICSQIFSSIVRFVPTVISLKPYASSRRFASSSSSPTIDVSAIVNTSAAVGTACQSTEAGAADSAPGAPFTAFGARRTTLPPNPPFSTSVSLSRYDGDGELRESELIACLMPRGTARV